jgi:pyruvate,water dikinase
VLNELVESVAKLRKLWGKEVDLEWAFDGEKLYYLQCRAVTARKYPVIYSNRLSREFLPGMIKPLVWSINIPVVNSAWIRLLESMLGSMGLKPEQLSHSFYYRAYFNMGTMGALFRELGFPRDSLERLLGRENPSGKSPFRPGLRTLRYVPRMFWFLLTNMKLGKKFRRWVENDERIDRQLIRELHEDFHIELYPSLLDRLMHRSKEAAYYNIVIPLAMHLTSRLLKRKLDRKGVSMESLDFFRDFPALKEYDPQYELRRLHELWQDIPAAKREEIGGYSDLQAHRSCTEVESFCQAFDIFMSSFGHFSESGNDLSYPHWNEDPDFVLKLIEKTEAKKEHKTQVELEKSPDGRKSMGGRAYKRAGRFRVYREMISSLYTREYGLFRILFQQCGLYLVKGGYIEQQNDVFYLKLEELNELLRKGEDLQQATAKKRISERKQEMADYQGLSMPSIIYGEVPPPIAGKGEEVFQGIPTSPGQFEGKIVVVRGYEDFDKDVADKILVIPFADVGWTPLLVKAGAIVSESGGMLSHAAIVSRELSIPSISSVDHACQIKDGTLAKLDGANGSLILKN